MTPSTVTELHPPAEPVPEPATPTAARRELGAFLRAHRERTAPETVGLPSTGRRRTPGLRREEVAALSGVGLAWYSWIEQGRVSTSRQILEAVARTLRLDDASVRHLLSLAGIQPQIRPETAHDAATEPAQRLLSSWPTTPAVLVDRRLDVTVWNPAYAAVFGDPGAVAPERRNLMWILVADPRLRETLVDWESHARALLAHFRAQTAPRMQEPRVRELYALLAADAPELSAWWSCQGVGDFRTHGTALDLPAGRVRLSASGLRPVEDPEALLVVHAPVAAADHALVETAVAAAAPRRLSRVG